MAQGQDRVTVRLNPASLGRVEVRIETGIDGQARINVTADRPETLNLLRQDAQSLERALQDAGLKADQNSLNFNLREGRDQAGRQLADQEGDGSGDGTDGGDEDGAENGASGREDDLDLETLLNSDLAERATARGGVDVKA